MGPCERRKALLAALKKFTTPSCGAKQNHVFRTNRKPRILPRRFSDLSSVPKKRQITKSPNFNTCANRSRNSHSISTSNFQDLKLLGINTYEKQRRARMADGRRPNGRRRGKPIKIILLHEKWQQLPQNETLAEKYRGEGCTSTLTLRFSGALMFAACKGRARCIFRRVGRRTKNAG